MVRVGVYGTFRTVVRATPVCLSRKLIFIANPVAAWHCGNDYGHHHCGAGMAIDFLIIKTRLTYRSLYVLGGLDRKSDQIKTELLEGTYH